MDDRLFRKVINLLFFLGLDYLISAYIYETGHPVTAGIVAAILLIVSIATVFIDRKYSGLDLLLPSWNTLATDSLMILCSIPFICLADAVDHFFLPMMVLLFVGALLDIIRMFKVGTFKDKSFKEIFHEQLRLPIELDAVLLFWPIYEGFTKGWNTLGTFEYVVIGLLTLDLIHNAIILPAKYRKEKQLLTEYFQQLENEKASLDSVDTLMPDLNDETKRLITDRINLIDHVLIGKMSGNTVFTRKANKEIEKVIADRSSFIKSLALRFAVSHPKAIGQLQQQGLSQYEIGLCCLYYMGYNGKEVKDISETSMVYHINSAIRQKLGLKANDVNLSTYIRELFQ